ncbi:Conidiation protein 6-domain-containing protein [Crepidotus variabilis]|uniref:Conidiation protein 6-domain-containing protein n=1 Tax=Crepidotus variabilis TaxID=179855 RepID=A0A9P6JM40_9AGAR|nr:Conidiation protein 6-domain-containing protein [Crepidotus variabilis]
MSATRQAGGYKAALANPNVTAEGKQAAAEKLHDLEDSGEIEAAGHEKNEGNVIGGYKATLKNPNVSEEAKEHAIEVLEEKGIEVERQ